MQERLNLKFRVLVADKTKGEETAFRSGSSLSFMCPETDFSSNPIEEFFRSIYQFKAATAKTL